MKIFAWLIAIFGLALTALPLYAELFTKKILETSSESTESDFAISASYGESFTMMHIPCWTPFFGGIIALTGGILISRANARRS